MQRIQRILILLILLTAQRVDAGLLINEVVCGSQGDWVEIFFQSAAREKKDISSLYVTMYYGVNEPLSEEPVSIYSYDRPETPYDDRFVVVHLTDPETPDETDRTGDTNRNGMMDLYCNNYRYSLWNTDCVVAIDSDDDPANGGIYDFIFYTNRDGGPGSTIASYTRTAQAAGQWQAYDGENIQECGIAIGAKGLSAGQSIARTGPNDTNGPADFILTSLQTPGRPNISLPLILSRHIFRAMRRKIGIVPGHPLLGQGTIPLFIFYTCTIKFRIFSVIGALVYESPLYTGLQPGFRNLPAGFLYKKPNLPTGLYLCKIEASCPLLKKTEEKVIYIIVSRYR